MDPFIFKSFTDVIQKHHLTKVKNEVFDAGIVENNGTYTFDGSGKGQCLGYRMLEPYESCEWELTEIKDKRIINRINTKQRRKR